MASLWPWLAVAGVGALHGLNPTTGWMFAAAWGLRSHDRSRALRALLPVAVGHLTSITLVAAAVSRGLSMDRGVVLGLAGVLLAAVAMCHLRGRTCNAPAGHAAHAGLALWSFMASTLHGAGLMLVPSLVSLCNADTPASAFSASGPLTLALAAVGVHTAAMLVVTGAVAFSVCRGADLAAGLLRCARPAGPHAPGSSQRSSSSMAASKSSPRPAASALSKAASPIA